MNTKYIFLFLSSILLLSGIEIFAQTANFTANKTQGCDNYSVVFTSLSTDATSFQWDFGDGSTSTLENPTNYYNAPGKYTVRLIVSDGITYDTLTKTDYIIVYTSPTIDFTADNTSGCFPLTVNFSDLSTLGDTTISSWQWDFGNGEGSTSHNPSFTYNAPGTYNVSLIIDDANGCNASLNNTAYISVINNELNADFTITNPAGCLLPHTTDIQNNSTGSITNYFWTFSNDSTSTEITPPQQSYDDYGIYPIKLVVLGAAGCIDSLTQQVEVNPYYASFTANKTSGCKPLNVTFTDNSLGATNWNWDFGDGGTSTSQNPSYTFNNPGTYTIYLSSSNSACSGDTTKVAYITVFDVPTTTFSASDSSDCKAPFVVNFTSTTSSATSWAWNFGDGETSTEENPSHLYQAVGSYNVKLVTADANGCTNTLISNSLINIVEPIADFTFDIDKGCKALPVSFSDLTFSNETITTWSWTFGDGSTSTDQNPLYTYPDTGAFTVTLIIENINGCIDTMEYFEAIHVGDHKNVNFAPLDTVICYKESVNFVDLSDPVTDQWHWEFCVGETNAHNPSHTYLDTGYCFTTFIAGFHGCFDTLFVDSNVLVRPPIARFNADKLIFCEADDPYTVSFHDTSVYATSWNWDFGDGDTAMTQHATHTFIDRDFYTVWLFVENDSFGCVDSISQIIKISNIDVGFVQDSTVGCEPFTVYFTDTTYTNSSASAWLWEFGDGQTSTVQNPTHIFNYIDSNLGFFDIKLYTTDALGCTDSVTYPSHIEVKEKPSPAFSNDLYTGCAPLTVQFTDESIGNAAPIASWAWYFGNDSTSTIQNPTMTYITRGIYTVTLSVTDTFGCENALSKPELIKPTRPYTKFNCSDVICNNTNVTFTNSSSPLVDLTYLWDFGDGSSTDTSSSPSHLYYTTADTSVTYTISLTATDLNGCDSTYTKDVRIASVQAGLTVNATNYDCPPSSVNFYDSSTCVPDSVVNWIWSFGDGATSTKPDTTYHSYYNAGSFDVSLIVENTYGCKDTTTIDSLINISGPIGSFTYTIDSSTCSPTFQFIAHSDNSELNMWDFDDGNSLIGDTVYYQYPDTGMFYPVLIMKVDNCEDEVELDSALHVVFPTLSLSLSSTDATCTMNDGTASLLSISGGLPPYTFIWPNGSSDSVQVSLFGGVYYVTATDSAGCPGRDSILVNTNWIQFNNNFTSEDAICTSNNGYAQANPSNGIGSYTYSWSTGDILSAISNLDEGTYRITITDSLGCNVVDSVQILRDTNIVINDSIMYKDAMCAINNGYAISIPDGGYAPYSFSWSNGYSNDTISDLAPSTYYLTITDSLGCVTTDSIVIALGYNNTISADFAMDSLEILGGLPLGITDQSTDSIPIVEWTWIIEDNSITDSTGSLIYTFYEAGIYSIEMIIKDEIGCLDTVSKNITIKEGLAIPNVFSPNGDGINDVFYVVSNGISEYQIDIFNRWGALVYSETSPYIQWTGRTTAGVEVPAGTYFYVLHAATKTGKTIDEKGYITLVR